MRSHKHTRAQRRQTAATVLSRSSLRPFATLACFVRLTQHMYVSLSQRTKYKRSASRCNETVKANLSTEAAAADIKHYNRMSLRILYSVRFYLFRTVSSFVFPQIGDHRATQFQPELSALTRVCFLLDRSLQRQHQPNENKVQPKTIPKAKALFLLLQLHTEDATLDPFIFGPRMHVQSFGYKALYRRPCSGHSLLIQKALGAEALAARAHQVTEQNTQTHAPSLYTNRMTNKLCCFDFSATCSPVFRALRLSKSNCSDGRECARLARRKNISERKKYVCSSAS